MRLLWIFTFIIICSLGYYIIRREQKVWDTTAQLSSSLPATEPLEFLILGDTGTGQENQYSVAKSMERYCRVRQREGQKIHGIILLGDNFYSQPKSIDDPLWESHVLKPYSSPCLKQSTIYPVLGNHDYDGDAEIQTKFKHPRWHMPHRFYQVGFGSLLQIVAFDSNFPDVCFSSQKCAVNFIWQHLNSGKDFHWSVVTAHHPLYSNSMLKYSHQGGLFGFITSRLLCSSFDAWLAGHAHHLEHVSGTECAGDIFISGGGGAVLYPLKQNAETHFGQSVHGFLVMNVTLERLKFRFHDIEGKILYEYERRKTD